jgi:DNA mismatch endonuclease (patch repair protein)
MQRMPRRDTGPEVALRRELHARGLRFRKNCGSLPGKPDVVFPGAQIAVFVDGCFWHRCLLHSNIPKTNSAWWAAKLDANVARDRRQDQQLADAGWVVVRVWEHEPVVLAGDRIQAMWRASRGEPPRS